MDGFFTTMLALNAAGPNMVDTRQTPVDGVDASHIKKVFICLLCTNKFQTHSEASFCCSKDKVCKWHACVLCGAEFDGAEARIQAMNCCHDAGSGADVKTLWECVMCESMLLHEDQAKKCCDSGAVVYHCLSCDQYHESKEDAQDCCKVVWQCMVCMCRADSLQEAVDCHMQLHPTLTIKQRQHMVNAIADGAEWIQALQAAINSPPFD